MKCRICKSNTKEILDLGSTPPENSLMTKPTEDQTSYPLEVYNELFLQVKTKFSGVNCSVFGIYKLTYEK